jgi:hypothetical protein
MLAEGIRARRVRQKLRSMRLERSSAVIFRYQRLGQRGIEHMPIILKKRDQNARTFQKFWPVIKVEESGRLITGVVTMEKEDRDGEICNYESTKPYYRRWSEEQLKATNGLSCGNLRAMHGLNAIGTGKRIEFRDNEKAIVMTFKIVDDAAWNLAREGALSSFSHGGKYVRVWNGADGLRHYTASPNEISLVDRPALAGTEFQFVRADGGVEMRKFASSNEQLRDGGGEFSTEMSGEEHAQEARRHRSLAEHHRSKGEKDLADIHDKIADFHDQGAKQAAAWDEIKQGAAKVTDQQINDYIDRWTVPDDTERKPPQRRVGKIAAETPPPAPKPERQAMAKGPLSGQPGPVEMMREQERTTPEANARTLSESPIFGSMSRVGIVGFGAGYGEPRVEAPDVDAQGSVKALDTSILDAKVNDWLSSIPEAQRRGAAPDLTVSDGPAEKMARSAKSPSVDNNASALASSATFSGMAKAGKIRPAVAGPNKSAELVRQLTAAIDAEPNPLGKRFLKALLKEVRSKS